MTEHNAENRENKIKIKKRAANTKALLGTKRKRVSTSSQRRGVFDGSVLFLEVTRVILFSELGQYGTRPERPHSIFCIPILLLTTPKRLDLTEIPLPLPTKLTQTELPKQPNTIVDDPKVGKRC